MVVVGGGGGGGGGGGAKREGEKEYTNYHPATTVSDK